MARFVVKSDDLNADFREMFSTVVMDVIFEGTDAELREQFPDGWDQAMPGSPDNPLVYGSDLFYEYTGGYRWRA